MAGARGPSRGRPRLSRRETAAATLVLLVVIVQFALPTAVLVGGTRGGAARSDSAALRYAWQMFTEPQVDVRYEVIANGIVSTVDPERQLGFPWGRVHYGQHALVRVCQAIPDVVTVIRYVTEPSGSERRQDSYSC